MLAPLATLAFLASIWLVTMILTQCIDQEPKIMAALTGRSLLAVAPATRPIAVRISLRARPQRTLHAQPQMRAAA